MKKQTKQNKTKQNKNKTKQNKTKQKQKQEQTQNKTKQKQNKNKTKTKTKQKQKQNKTKQNKTNDRCSEECDARRSESNAARTTYYALQRNRYRLHGQNNKATNCCFTGNTNTKKRKKIPA